MSFHLQGNSKGRDSEVGRIVESFIDANDQVFSMEQLALLEQLAEEVDDKGKEQEKELEEHKGRIEELEGEQE